MFLPNKLKAVIPWLWLLVYLYAFESQCLQRQAYLKRASGSECQMEQLGDPWLSESLTKCYLKCLTRFSHVCQSIIYNTENKTCTPGSVALRPLTFIQTSIPSADSIDKIYFVEQPVPQCNTSRDDLALYSFCGLTLCLHLSKNMTTYLQARHNCDLMGTRLLLGDTLSRFAMFWHLAKQYFNNHTWIGLNDLVQEGTFVWDNGEMMTADQTRYWMFLPDNANGREHCGEVRLPGWKRGLNDAYCEALKYYMCEPINS